jgi:hypothetical protein
MCEYPEVFTSQDRTARKQHSCCQCQRSINPGQTYRYASGIFDGQPFHYKICTKCAELSDFIWTLPETECIDGLLCDHLHECEYIENHPHEEEVERGSYCSITAAVPWLKRVGQYWELNLESMERPLSSPSSMAKAES